MLVAASRFDEELMPSSDRLFWISRWPAPRKLRPMSLFRPPSTPGVVLARFQTLRPLQRQVDDRPLADGLRDRRAVGVEDLRRRLDVHRLGEPADLQRAFVRTTWLVATFDAGRLEGLEAGDA